VRDGNHDHIEIPASEQRIRTVKPAAAGFIRNPTSFGPPASDGLHREMRVLTQDLKVCSAHRAKADNSTTKRRDILWPTQPGMLRLV
jgi:hypothetical protein